MLDANEINAEIDDNKAVLVDVRSDGEYQAGHAKGAVHLSLDRIMSGELPTKDKSTKLYLYCASGNRSGMATQVLKQQGYDAENIGGLIDWQSANGAVVRS